MGLTMLELRGALSARQKSGKMKVSPKPRTPETRLLLDEDAFVSMLYLERRRAERAQKRFMLMLVDIKNVIAESYRKQTLSQIIAPLTNITRETDIIGWYL